MNKKIVVRQSDQTSLSRSKVLERIQEAVKKSDASAWGKGIGGGYPWRKK